MSDEPPDDMPVELAPRPAPSPEEVLATGRGWTEKQVAAWGVPWKPPKGWRSELLHLHAIGADVTPLAYRPRSGRQERREARREAAPPPPPTPKPARPSTPSAWPTERYQDAQGRWWNPQRITRVHDIGTPDRDDPPPWL
jgi:hypothetical protein